MGETKPETHRTLQLLWYQRKLYSNQSVLSQDTKIDIEMDE